MAIQIADPAQTHAFTRIDFDHFHQATIKELIATHIGLFQHELVGLKSLSFVTAAGDGYTYLPGDGSLTVVPGVHGALKVSLCPDAFSDFFHELLSISGLKVTRRMEQMAGDIEEFRAWEPTLRAIFAGRPIYSSEVPARLRNARNQPFDIEKSFDYSEFEQQQDEMREYFSALGYLHIRQVFSAQEVDEIRDHVLDAIKQSTPDDGKSWWSLLEDGREVPTRINYLNRFSDFFDRLGNDARVQALGKLHDAKQLVCLDRVDGPMVFIKSPNVKTGLANLLWHRDCDLGGHPIMCPIIQVGIQLDRASAENGQVKVVIGSHLYSSHVVDIDNEGDLPVHAFNTEPGDVTLHFGDTLHCTPAPTGPSAQRKVLYYKFEKPEMFDTIPAGGHYNDLLFNASHGGRVATRATTWTNNNQLDGDLDQ